MNDEQTTRPLPPRPDDTESSSEAPSSDPSITRQYPVAEAPTPPHITESLGTAPLGSTPPGSARYGGAPAGAVPAPASAASVLTHGPHEDEDVSLYEPQPMPWVMGALNVLFSAVLTVLWLWVPISLFVTGVGGLFALGAGIFALALWFFLQRGINHLERVRAEAVYGEHILQPEPRRTRRTGFVGWLHQQWLIVTWQGFWRSAAHHLVKTLFGGVVGIVFLAGLVFSMVALTSAVNPTIVDVLISPDASMLVRVALGVAGAAATLAAFTIVAFSPLVDRLLDRSLLPPTRAAVLRAQRDSLTQEVGILETARTGAVDSATSERLRIERDLHDGVQPMLVALSMKLGMAQRKLDTDFEAGKTLVAEAHRDSKDAITELRQLARGIHPAVLEDRGLDAAVSAVAARSSVPVTVNLQVPDGVSTQTESVAYFVVAESLTNIAKHAQASSAKVSIHEVAGKRLQIVVVDDGMGGAQIDRGGVSTGLAGLSDRVAAAKGTMTVTSPVGGPTTIVAEVPCAS